VTPSAGREGEEAEGIGNTQTERYFQAILDTLPQHIAILDETGAILTINRAWRLFAQENGCATGNYALGTNYLETCDRAHGDCSEEARIVADGIRAVIGGEREAFSIDYPCHSPQQHRWFRVYVSRIEEGQPTRVVVSHHNITREKQDAEALREARAELEQRVRERTAELEALNQTLQTESEGHRRARETLVRQAQELVRSNRELEQFAYVASHDLQEPLRMITSYLQLIERRYSDHLDTDGREFIGYAVDGASRMKLLIEDLLAYSRVGTRNSPFAPVECEAILKTALSDLMFSVSEEQVLLTHDPLPVVHGDERQLITLFSNLIGNAMKFRRELPCRIHVSARPEREEWVFTVEDNGIGIAAEYFDRIFIIFQRLHHREEYAGTGIGLAICKKIVERHGGHIWVESKPGIGSRFSFTLPIRAGSDR
jgi:signal transduction histidine kinase